MRPEINFVHPSISKQDRFLFLGPFDDQDGPFVDIQPDWTMAHIMHEAGIFSSVGQAKKNGWDRLIQPGFDMFFAGKKANRKQIVILNELIEE